LTGKGKRGNSHAHASVIHFYSPSKKPDHVLSILTTGFPVASRQKSRRDREKREKPSHTHTHIFPFAVSFICIALHSAARHLPTVSSRLFCFSGHRQLLQSIAFAPGCFSRLYSQLALLRVFPRQFALLWPQMFPGCLFCPGFDLLCPGSDCPWSVSPLFSLFWLPPGKTTCPDSHFDTIGDNRFCSACHRSQFSMRPSATASRSSATSSATFGYLQTIGRYRLSLLSSAIFTAPNRIEPPFICTRTALFHRSARFWYISPPKR